MTATILLACFAWSVALGFLTCTNATFQPPNVLLSPGSRKTGRNQPRPAGTSRKGN